MADRSPRPPRRRGVRARPRVEGDRGQPPELSEDPEPRPALAASRGSLPSFRFPRARRFSPLPPDIALLRLQSGLQAGAWLSPSPTDPGAVLTPETMQLATSVRLQSCKQAKKVGAKGSFSAPPEISVPTIPFGRLRLRVPELLRGAAVLAGAAWAPACRGAPPRAPISSWGRVPRRKPKPTHACRERAAGRLADTFFPAAGLQDGT